MANGMIRGAWLLLFSTAYFATQAEGARGKLTMLQRVDVTTHDEERLAKVENAKELDDKKQAHIANEVADKSQLRNQKLQALQEGGAEGVVKEKAAKTLQLHEKAEHHVMAEAQERSAKTIPQLAKILEVKKTELKEKFHLKLHKIQKQAVHRGAILVHRAKEAGEKAFFSPGVRKETRLKQKKKYQVMDKSIERTQKFQDHQTLRVAAATNEVITQLSANHMEKAEEQAASLQTEAHNPNLLQQIAAQQTIDQVAKSQDVKPPMDPSSTSDPGLSKAMERFNNVITGAVPIEELAHAEAVSGFPNITQQYAASNVTEPSEADDQANLLIAKLPAERAVALAAMTPDEKRAVLAAMSPEDRAASIPTTEAAAANLVSLAPVDRAATLQAMSLAEKEAVLAAMSPADRLVVAPNIPPGGSSQHSSDVHTLDSSEQYVQNESEASEMSSTIDVELPGNSQMGGETGNRKQQAQAETARNSTTT